MRVTFCGTGQAYLDPERAGASIFVEHDGAGALLDCGPGSLSRIPAAGLRLDQIKVVLLSHLHFDHTLGIPELLTRFAFEESELPVFYGPPGTGEYMTAAVEFARSQLRFLAGGLWVDRLDHVKTHETKSGTYKILDGMVAEPQTVPHAADLHAIAWRLQAGRRTLVYSGDTAPAHEALPEFARGADMLIHESYSEAALAAVIASMPAERQQAVRQAFADTHSDVSSAALIATQAGVRTLVLTHLLPAESEQELEAAARQEFEGAVVVAHDGLSIDV